MQIAKLSHSEIEHNKIEEEADKLRSLIKKTLANHEFNDDDEWNLINLLTAINTFKRSRK